MTKKPTFEDYVRVNARLKEIHEGTLQDMVGHLAITTGMDKETQIQKVKDYIPAMKKIKGNEEELAKLLVQLDQIMFDIDETKYEEESTERQIIEIARQDAYRIGPSVKRYVKTIQESKEIMSRLLFDIKPFLKMKFQK